MLDFRGKATLGTGIPAYLGAVSGDKTVSAIAFDTHAFVKRLISVGMPEAQAEVLAEEQAKLMETQFAAAATKTDLREAVLTLEARIEVTKSELLKWIVGAIGLQTIVIIGAVVALTRVVK